MSKELAPNQDRVPKVFLSYSWTSQSHMDWVMQLATDLRASGVDAIIDRWHLSEGQDAHAFMEKTVQDENISKVALICDKKYVERANKREGGVGAESQIITAEILTDVEQTKFAALVLDSNDNGSALLPNFMTSRIYVDFRNTDHYSENFEKLVRWIFDKPIYSMPPIGRRPTFLDDQIGFNPTSLIVPSARRHQEKGVGSGVNFLSFWREATAANTDFTLNLDSDGESDDEIVSAIKSLPPLISDLIVNIRDRAEIGEMEEAEVDQLLEFLSNCLGNYRSGSTSWSGDVTKFFANFMLVSMCAIFLRNRRFASLVKLLSGKLLSRERGSYTTKGLSVARVGTSLESLAYRNKRLELRRTSLFADTVKEICEQVPIEFVEFLQADFFLFMFYEFSGLEGQWWPDTNIYAVDSYGSYPIFVRAVREPLRTELLQPLNLNGISQLESLEEEIRAGKFQGYRWSSSFTHLSFWSLANLGAILESYRSEN